MSKFTLELENEGFHHENTGGNCTAYVKPAADFEFLITDGEASAPEQFPCVLFLHGAGPDFEQAHRHVDDLSELIRAELSLIKEAIR